MHTFSRPYRLFHGQIIVHGHTVFSCPNGHLTFDLVFGDQMAPQVEFPLEIRNRSRHSETFRGAFRGCQLLNWVTAPGCVEFGYKAFAECSSLQWVYATEGVANQFCSSTKFGHYLFRDCINLATFALQEAAHQQELPARMNARELSQGCLSSTGIGTLELTRDFQVLGAHACDNCRLLKKVDLSITTIEEIRRFDSSFRSTVRSRLRSTVRRPGSSNFSIL